MWDCGRVLLKSGSHNWQWQDLGRYTLRDLGHSPLENSKDSQLFRANCRCDQSREASYSRKRVQCTVNVKCNFKFWAFVAMASKRRPEDTWLLFLFYLLQLRVLKWCNFGVSQYLKLWRVTPATCRSSKYPWHTRSKFSCRFTTKIKARTQRNSNESAWRIYQVWIIWSENLRRHPSKN